MSILPGAVDVIARRGSGKSIVTAHGRYLIYYGEFLSQTPTLRKVSIDVRTKLSGK
jgi:hypothetical protein